MKLATIPAALACAGSLLAALPSADGVRAAELPASIANLRLREGESLLSVRSRLIKSGWAPIKMHAGENYEYDGAEKRLVERHFYEVDSCSTDRGALCVLYYKKGTTCLRIDTVGEQVESMQVTTWEASCPAMQENQSETSGRKVLAN